MPTRSRPRRKPSPWPTLLLSAVAVACALGAGSRIAEGMAATKRMEELQRQAVSPALLETALIYVDVRRTEAGERDDSVEPAEATQAWTGAVAAQTLEQLQAENPDFVGWLRLTGTKVDYPVMHSPDRPQYYLRRDFFGEKATGGTPFLDDNCVRSGSRANWIIYGHNMKNGAMFGQLKKLLDADYYAQHRELTFDLPGRPGRYRIAAVYRTRVDVTAEFKFYHYANVTTEADFDRYCANIMARSVHQADTELTWGDELLTLVTCSGHVKDGRLLAVAKRMN